MDNESLVIYIIVVLCLGAVLIMSKDKLPPRLKRGMALTAVILVALAFIFIICSLLA
ncbi:signal transduction histidine kinase [Paenibacillus sp. FSL R7-0273]|nr:signal transduction histidine kinase [Paenibacillus sp. FSL R7-0273]